MFPVMNDDIIDDFRVLEVRTVAVRGVHEVWDLFFPTLTLLNFVLGATSGAAKDLCRDLGLNRGQNEAVDAVNPLDGMACELRCQLRGELQVDHDRSTWTLSRGNKFVQTPYFLSRLLEQKTAWLWPYMGPQAIYIIYMKPRFISLSATVCQHFEAYMWTNMANCCFLEGFSSMNASDGH